MQPGCLKTRFIPDTLLKAHCWDSPAFKSTADWLLQVLHLTTTTSSKINASGIAITLRWKKKGGGGGGQKIKPLMQVVGGGKDRRHEGVCEGVTRAGASDSRQPAAWGAGWNGSGCLCGHLCFGPASPCLWQPGCGTRRWAGSLSHPRAREVVTSRCLWRTERSFLTWWETMRRTVPSVHVIPMFSEASLISSF